MKALMPVADAVEKAWNLLITNALKPIALEVGQRFAIREGGKTVGAGKVSRIVE